MRFLQNHDVDCCRKEFEVLEFCLPGHGPGYHSRPRSRQKDEDKLAFFCLLQLPLIITFADIYKLLLTNFKQSNMAHFGRHVLDGANCSKPRVSKTIKSRSRKAGFSAGKRGKSNNKRYLFIYLFIYSQANSGKNTCPILKMDEIYINCAAF